MKLTNSHIAQTAVDLRVPRHKKPSQEVSADTVIGAKQAPSQYSPNQSESSEFSDVALANSREAKFDVSPSITIDAKTLQSRSNSVLHLNEPQNRDHTMSFKAQQALQVFADNMPNPAQEYGIELIGVDAYV